MNAAIKGYLYLAVAALLLIVALPTIVHIVIIGLAVAFIIAGSVLLKDNLGR